MTTRIGHSLGAMRRLIQMLPSRVFIYVEGRDVDPNFYSRLLGPICSDRGLPYEIIIADRVVGGGGGGGKTVLIRLLNYLRLKNSLIDRSSGISKLVMFYLDKDTDDIFRKKCRSNHLVYTVHYCVENHLFIEGDLISSIATAGSVDVQLVRRRIANLNTWRRGAAVAWRNWIVLCLVAQRLRISGQASYSANHDTVNSKVNPPNLAACELDLQTRSALNATQFAEMVNWARRRVDRVIHDGTHDLLFKGKWYVHFALNELNQIATTHGPVNQNGANHRLVGSLVSTIRFDEQWAEHYKEPFRRAIASL
jgi:hypothetical protein